MWSLETWLLQLHLYIYDFSRIIPLSGGLVEKHHIVCFLIQQICTAAPCALTKSELIVMSFEKAQSLLAPPRSIFQKQHTACQGPCHLCLFTRRSGIYLGPSQGFKLRSWNLLCILIRHISIGNHSTPAIPQHVLPAIGLHDLVICNCWIPHININKLACFKTSKWYVIR